jgi:transforming growth factor-beta-induced protein
MTIARYLVPLAAISLLGCNGGNDDDTDTDVSNTIVDVASANEDFSLLVQAVVRAGLVDTLSSAGPFTVFAPTNDAFQALLDTNDDWQSIDDIDVAVLTDVLLYHVVAANVPSSAIPARADSVLDVTLFFDASGPKVNAASITSVDIQASNGVIHVIDQVLLPPNLVDAAGFAGLTSLQAAVVHGQVGPNLRSAGPFTVFAPTNAAFSSALTALGVSAVTDIDPGTLSGILLYHAVPARVPSSEVSAGIVASAATNQWQHTMSLFLSTEGGVKVNGTAVVDTDIKATNGIIHVIDGVILPPTIGEAAGLAGLTGLIGAIEASSAPTALLNVVNGAGPLTVFAPTNAAFGEISDVIPTLSGETITYIVQSHVIASLERPVSSADLTSGQVETASGENVTIDAPAGTVSLSNTANIVVTDINTVNGVVHLIDAVLLPAL